VSRKHLKLLGITAPEHGPVELDLAELDGGVTVVLVSYLLGRVEPGRDDQVAEAIEGSLKADVDVVVIGIDLVTDQTVLLEEQHRELLAVVSERILSAEFLEDFGVGRVEVTEVVIAAVITVDVHHRGGHPCLAAILAGTNVTHSNQCVC